MSEGIRGNQVKPINKITQDEHQDAADAKRVVFVSKDGEQIVDVVQRGDGKWAIATDSSLSVGSIIVDLDGVGVGGDTVGIVGVGGNRLVVNNDGSISVSDSVLTTLLTSIEAILSGTLQVDDNMSQLVLSDILAQLADIFVKLDSGTLKVDDDQTQVKLDSVITGLANVVNAITGMDNFWTILKKAPDLSEAFGYSNVTVGARVVKRLDYIDVSAPSASITQKIRRAFTWADFGTRDERLVLKARVVMPI